MQTLGVQSIDFRYRDVVILVALNDTFFYIFDFIYDFYVILYGKHMIF
jgi:hypothetical protein